MYDVGQSVHAEAQVDALPSDALAPFAELRVALETAPWAGEPYRPGYPDGPIRTLT